MSLQVEPVASLARIFGRKRLISSVSWAPLGIESSVGPTAEYTAPKGDSLATTFEPRNLSIPAPIGPTAEIESSTMDIDIVSFEARATLTVTSWLFELSNSCFCPIISWAAFCFDVMRYCAVPAAYSNPCASAAAGSASERTSARRPGRANIRYS